MKKRYLILRTVFFWIFFLTFIVVTPFIVSSSLGFKFDIKLKKFSRTGALWIKTTPKGARILLDGKLCEGTTPLLVRDLSLGEHRVLLEKEGFYPYQMQVNVKTGLVNERNVVLISVREDTQKIALDIDVYAFFVIKHILLGLKIIAFTDKGIYAFDRDFEDGERLSSDVLERDVADTILGIRQEGGIFLFWNARTIWQLPVPGFVERMREKEKQEYRIQVIYKADEGIKDVFFAMKGRYCIIHDGFKVIALDIKNSKMQFDVYQSTSIHAKIFYESASDTLWIKDKIPHANQFSLFKKRLQSDEYEKKEN